MLACVRVGHPLGHETHTQASCLPTLNIKEADMDSVLPSLSIFYQKTVINNSGYRDKEMEESLFKPVNWSNCEIFIEV